MFTKLDMDVVELTISEMTDDQCDCLYDHNDSDFSEEEVIQPNNEEAGFNYLYW